MARFLIGSVPAIGHVAPALPIARALVARGHEVRWYTGRHFRGRIEATGARHEPPRAVPDSGGPDPVIREPGGAGLTGLAALKFGIKHLFVDAGPGQLADLRRIMADFPADVVLCDTAFNGALFLHELGGPPRAVYGTTPLTIASRDTAPFGLGLPPLAGPLGRLRNRALYALFDRILFRDVRAHYDRVRAGLGLPPSSGGIFGDAVSPHLYLQGTVAAFEYPRGDLPPQVHFIGPSLPGPDPDFAPPPWWGELRATRRPIVHVTQGTVTTAADQLLLPTLRALADEAILVVATTGGVPVAEAGLGAPPGNARVAPFIPHQHLLPHVDAMVTNGGYGGVQMALANGVPLVAAGRTEEKPEVCARVAWSGAGLDLGTHRPDGAQIRAAVRAVLDQPRYRRATTPRPRPRGSWNASPPPGGRCCATMPRSSDPGCAPAPPAGRDRPADERRAEAETAPDSATAMADPASTTICRRRRQAPRRARSRSDRGAWTSRRCAPLPAMGVRCPIKPSHASGASDRLFRPDGAGPRPIVHPCLAAARIRSTSSIVLAASPKWVSGDRPRATRSMKWRLSCQKPSQCCGAKVVPTGTAAAP